MTTRDMNPEAEPETDEEKRKKETKSDWRVNRNMVPDESGDVLNEGADTADTAEK
jgi:hypothetical protein